jgi:hypothetical protein
MTNNPPPATRPNPPKLNEMCICGRTRHPPIAACPNPQPAGRQRPSTPEHVHAMVETTRRLLTEKRTKTTPANE